MKKVNTILILAVLLFMVSNLNAQEERAMNVHYRNGTTITVAVSKIASITFPSSEPFEEGVVINGIRWATRNVDIPGTFTAKPEDAGMFYQWNRKIGWNSTEPSINSNGGGTWDSSIPEGDTWERANDPCPAGWRVPTHSEQISLAEVGGFRTFIDGVWGYIFGSDEQFIFFPEAGSRSADDGKLNKGGGDYWSSSMYDIDCAYETYLADYGYPMYRYRSFGASVRCVAE